jgi:hypothetical protein
MEGFSLVKAAALAVVLATAFTAMFAPPAEAGRRGRCDFPVERFYGKTFVKNSGCTYAAILARICLENAACSPITERPANDYAQFTVWHVLCAPKRGAAAVPLPQGMKGGTS